MYNNFIMFFYLFSTFIIKNFIYLIFIYLVISFYNKNKFINKNEIKGPIGFPIVGNMIQLGGIEPHIEMMKLEKKYNNSKGLIRIWIGDNYCIFLSDLNLIKEIFIKNFETYYSRPKSPLVKLGTNNFRGINGASGECWLKNKTIVMDAMKRANIRKIYKLLDENVNDLIKEMSNFEKYGKSFYPKQYFRKFVLSIMFNYIFNETVSLEEHENLENSKVSELTKEIQNIFKTMKVGRLLNSIKLFQSPYYWYLKKTDKTFKNIKLLIIEKYYQHLKTIDYNNPRDLLDILITEYSKNKKNQNNNNNDDNDDEMILNITQVALDMFMAGTDSSANTLEWIIIKLCNNPIHQELAFKELKEASLNSNEITLKDRPKTPYTNAIIKETIRMHPVVVFGLPRYSEVDSTVGGYFIPKNTRIFINYHSIGYNDKLFKDPFKFEPNRFINDASSNNAYFPFGLGQRQCIGLQLANDQIYLCIANILLNYKLKTKEKINEKGVYGLTVSPNKFEIILESRNN